MKVARFERIRGINEDLPAAEHVLWQGRPGWRSLALRAFHVREVGLYFILLAAFAAVTDVRDGRSPAGGLLPLGMGAIACGLLLFLAWLSSRTTIYAVTTRRVFLRVGIALPLTINLPLRRIEAARLALHADGSGDLPLALEPGPHLAYLHLWPHARPWCLKRPEPMMRSVPDAQRVAGILADALRAAQDAAPDSAAYGVADEAGTAARAAGAAGEALLRPEHRRPSLEAAA